MALLHWLRVNQILGPALDGEQVHLLGIVLSNAAIEWYNVEVTITKLA